MQATIACLLEYGYPGTTTVAVCRRAGVSHGSLLHHYGTRAKLLGAALQVVYGRLKSPVVASLERLPEGSARVDALVELLWEAFGAPEFKAVLELWMAASNDPDLGWNLWPEARAFDASMLPLAESLFPGVSERVPDFDLLITLLFQAMQGMGLAQATHRSDEGDAVRTQLRGLLGRIIRQAFES